MLTEADQESLTELEDNKLAIDALKVLFKPDGESQPKHRKALDALARFCKVELYNYGFNQTEIFRTTGRREVYNYIMWCLEYPEEERRKLKTQISNLEDIRDGRDSDRTDDD